MSSIASAWPRCPRERERERERENLQCGRRKPSSWAVACTWKKGFNAPMAKLATFKGMYLAQAAQTAVSDISTSISPLVESNKRSCQLRSPFGSVRSQFVSALLSSGFHPHIPNPASRAVLHQLLSLCSCTGGAEAPKTTTLSQRKETYISLSRSTCQIPFKRNNLTRAELLQEYRLSMSFSSGQRILKNRTHETKKTQ